MTVVLDASVILAFVQDEPGSDVVEQALAGRTSCGAANWSEVAQKVIRAGRDWDLVRTLLLSYDLAIEPVTQEDAERAAHLWKEGTALSLADRLCLALAVRLDGDALTADTTWGSEGRVRQIR